MIGSKSNPRAFSARLTHRKWAPKELVPVNAQKPMSTENATPSVRPSRGRATRARLLAAAEGLFVAEGYSGVSIDRIVNEANVTKGAFYHHFPDKLTIFRELFVAIDTEMAERVLEAALSGESLQDKVCLGMRQCFQLCTQARYSRIVYLQGPAVLGWEEWNRIDMQISEEVVVAGLQDVVDLSQFPALESIGALSTLLLGAVLQGAITISTSPDPDTTCQALSREIDRAVPALLNVYLKAAL